MLAVAVVDCGLTPGEFWKLSPREFHAITKRANEKDIYNQFLLGHVVSWIVNWLFQGKERPKLNAKKVFPEVEQLEPPKKELEPSELDAQIHSIFGSW